MPAFYITMVVFTIYLAYKKEKNMILWSIFSILIPPLALIVILFVKPGVEPGNESLLKRLFTLDLVWLKRYKYPLIIIFTTVLSGVTGLVYTLLNIYLRTEAEPYLYYIALDYELDGEELNLDILTQLASIFSSHSYKTELYTLELLNTEFLSNIVVFGGIGLLLSIIFTIVNSKSETLKNIALISEVKLWLNKYSKQLVSGILILIISVIVIGNAGYYFEIFRISHDHETYFYEKFEELYSEENFAYIEDYVWSFVEGDYLFVEGAIMYEANSAKKYYTIFGLIVGIGLVIYRNRNLLSVKKSQVDTPKAI